jgi:hypothetical protein
MTAARNGVGDAVGRDIPTVASEPDGASAAPPVPVLHPAPAYQSAVPDPTVVRDRPAVDRSPVHHSADLELFRRAVAALLADPPESDWARLHGIEAAAALVAMAMAGDPRLARILRPDPDDAGPVAWTVACYQIGDLSPATLKDFSGVDEAVRAAARCDDAAHVAAELVASSASGMRWTAMARTGEILRFQLPGTSTGGAPCAGGALDAARERWAGELARGEAEADEPVDTSGPRRGEPLGAMPPELRVALGQIVEAMQALARRVDDLASSRDVRERLYALEQTVVELQLQFRSSSLAPAPGRRDLQLGPAAEAPARRLWRPGVNAPPLTTLSGRRARANPPLTERVLAAINRATARGLAAARRQRARSPEVARRTLPEELSLDRHVCAEYDRGGTERSGASMTPESPGPSAAPRRMTDSSGWCIDGPYPG